MRKNKTAYLWMALAVSIVSFSTVYPVFFSIQYSLFDTRIFTFLEFVWFDNYVSVLTDSSFWSSVYRSAYFTFVGVIITFVCGFFLGLLIRKQTKLNAVYRTLILIPWVLNEIAFALMWVWVLNPQMSPIYYWSAEIGLPLTNLLNNPQYALTTLTVINGLRAVGFALVLVIAAFSTIPKEVEEAGELDGCVGAKRIWYLYLPMIRPVSSIIIIVLTISFFNIIGLVLLMTGGGPLNTTELLSLKIYKEGFNFFNIAIASTLTTILLMINLGFAWIYNKLLNADNT